MPSKPCKKPCGAQKVCNPTSGRCILRSGKLGQSLKFHSKSNKPSKHRSKSKSHKRSKSRVKKDTKSRSRKNEFIPVIIKQEHVRKLSSATITRNNVKMSIMSMINFINPFSITKPELWKASFKVPKSLLNSYNASNLTEFLNNNQTYLDRLSMRERINLYGYTKAGDQLVNMYLRNDIQALEQYIISNWGNYQHIPIYYQLRDRGAPEDVNEMHSWLRIKDTSSLIKIFISAIKSYIDELVKIFNNSPALTRPITVFRGVKTAYYKTDNSNIFHNKEFMSASLDPDIALTFTDSTAGCCFKQINLIPGAKAIFIAPLSQEPNELEVLLPPGNKFIVSEKINTTRRAQDSTARTLSRITVLQQV